MRFFSAFPHFRRQNRTQGAAFPFFNSAQQDKNDAAQSSDAPISQPPPDDNKTNARAASAYQKYIRLHEQRAKDTKR